ncbi:uncharacterized protein [Dysidea avara]|uniref:uncharacterized protein isoform X2 n=1 Tax=Dysidea avara TaxID=196820 RepID=UPI00332CC59B
MMRQNYLSSGCAFLYIGWMLLIQVYGCEDQCYKPNITSMNLQRDENDVVVDGACYSMCALMDTSLDMFSSLNCIQRVMLNGCVAGCNHSRHPSLFSECQLKCSSCINGSETKSAECNECDFTTCMVGCNSTINSSRSGISLDNTNVTLVPVPGKLYIYKASFQISNDFQNTIMRRSNFGPFAYIVRVSSLDSSVTFYRLLYDPSTDVVDLTQYSAHCKSANISVAVVNSEGISEYSSSTEMCITALYPQAATNLQSCFGEEVGFNVSSKFIINLQWELPKDVTNLEGFMLSIVPVNKARRRRCKSLDAITLKKDQTRYTVGQNEQISNRCDYRISLISMPRNSDNNTIMVTQSTSLWTCNSHLDSNISLIQQNNINGRTNYTIHLFLESDPAALQALDYFRIHIIGYGTEPSYLFPASTSSNSNGLGPQCFSDIEHREYTCSDNCNSLQYNMTDLERCIEECEDASEYSIALHQFFPSNENLSFVISFVYKQEYSYRCRYFNRAISTTNARCHPPTAPRNLTVLSNSTQTHIVVVNLTWALPEHTHGHINFYVVEFYYNNTAVITSKKTKNNETTFRNVYIDLFTIISVRVRADNGCKNFTWSNSLAINPVDFFPPKQQSSSDNPLYHSYNIATGIVVGCIAFAAAAVLAE